MPIYMPWLTIASSVIVLVSCASTISGCLWALPLYLAIFISLLTLSFFRIIKIGRAVLFLAFIPLIVCVYTQQYLPLDAKYWGIYNDKVIVFRAKLLEKPKPITINSNLCTAAILTSQLLFPEQKVLASRLQLFITPYSVNSLTQFEEGQLLEIKGKFKTLNQKQEPWLSGLEQRFEKQNIIARVYTNTNKIKILNSAWEKPGKAATKKYLIDQLRTNISHQHQLYLGQKSGSLLASMVLGDRAITLDASLLQSFRKVGLSHIVAASGFNLTIVTMITYWILRRLLTSRLLITTIVCSNVVFYALLAGFSASIVRSAIACLLVLLINLYYRKAHRISALAMVLFINLVADPRVIMDLGAQLSYTAVTGILIGAEPLTDLLSFGSKNKIITVFSGSLAVILLAQAAVLPIQLYHFWQSSLLFLPANLLVDPLVSPLTIIGFISSFIALIDFGSFKFLGIFCYLLDLLASIPLDIIIFITEKLASSKYSSINIGQPSLSSLLIYYSSFAIFLGCLNKAKHRSIALILYSAALAFLFHRADLNKPLIVFLPRSIIAINSQRQAICLGDSNSQTNKILSFYGAELVSRKCLPERVCLFKLCSHPDISIFTEEQTQNPSFIISIESKNHLPAKKISVCMTNKPKKESISLPPLEQGQPLSQDNLYSELPEVEIKTCCPRHSIDLRSLSVQKPHSL